MIIDPRYNGPPGSGNGGYSAGLFATALAATALAAGGPVEVTLRRPPPLSVPLAVDGAEVRAPDGEMIAEVRPTDPFAAAVPGVGPAEAAAAARTYPGFTDHPFPTCYVCGPDRPDGLRIFPGRLPDGRVAAPFLVPGPVRPETVWAALDCPGGWSVLSAGRPYVLGRIAAVTRALPAPGDRCVVMGAAVAVQGRKAEVNSTLYGPAGEPLAYARATWIAI